MTRYIGDEGYPEYEQRAGLLARIEVYETPVGGHRVQSYLRHGLTGTEFAALLRQLAEGFERGTINRVE